MVKLLLASTLLLSSPVWAQLDLSGVWAPSFHEDNPERGQGPGMGVSIDAEHLCDENSWIA